MMDYLQMNTEFGDVKISARDCMAALTKEQQALLEQNTVELVFKKGEAIIKQGYVASHVLYLEEGLAKMEVTDDYVTSTIKLLASGSFVGIMCTFACRSVDFSAVALENTRIRMINIEVFKRLIIENGQFAMLLIQHMSTLTNSMVHWMSKIAHKHIDGALAMILLEFADIYGADNYHLPITRKALAEMLGYSKESVINALSKFNKEELIRVEDKRIVLLNKDKLKLIMKVS